MIVIPASQEALALADWLETSLLTQEAVRISDSAILDVLTEADLLDPEELLAALTQTVRMRRSVVGDGYPIVRDGQGFSRSMPWQEALPYSFMLFASLNQSYEELTFKRGTGNRPAELFEELAARAIEFYMNCVVVRIGAPRRSPIPSPFPKALEYCASAIGEILHEPDLEDHKSGDDGVDLIGWKTFNDARASQAILLAQCAIGTDWRDKRDGVSLELWRRHIDWHSPHPLKGFAIPFHHQPGRPWRETGTRAGIIFDRLRIAKLVGHKSLALQARTAMVAWCGQRTKQISRLAT